MGDAKLFAEIAEEEKDLLAALQWLRLFPKLKKRYKKLAKVHDDLVNFEPKKVVERRIRTAFDPLEETVYEKTDVEKILNHEKTLCPPFSGDEPKLLCYNGCYIYTRGSEINRLCQG